MRYVCPSAAAFLTLTFLAPSMLFAQGGAAGLSIDNYQFVSEQRSTRTEWFVTYKADLVNTSAARTGVVATVTSLVPSVKVVAGQNTLHFGAVGANSRVTSTDTFTILVDRSVTFDFANLKWSFLNPVANPGPNQTVAVGTQVTLNGSGSTNPSGVGTLTYAWAFASKPGGSNAVLATPNAVATSFMVDLPGNYVINLTVDNGAAKDTRAVTVSTNNSPPVSKAGPNQTASAGATVNLNGSGSFDVDGDPLTYTWSFVSFPQGSEVGRAGIGSFRSVKAFFVPDIPGTYIIQLLVNDGKLDSLDTPDSKVTITVGPAANTAPVADAGPPQANIPVGSTVQLNGAGSTDVNGDTLTYKWTLISKPVGSNAVITNPTTVNPTFVADVAGAYVAQLIVNDGKIDSQPSTVTIMTGNPLVPPTANAGNNQTVVHGTLVTLNGSGTDQQNLPLTYSWSFNAKPAGSTATLSSATVAKPTFVADKVGQYVLQLIVNNGTQSSQPSTVTITTTNTAPVANAGPNQTVMAGTLVNLDGSGSNDADNDPLTYSWSFTSRPNGSTATLSAANSKTPTFMPDVPGAYVVQLIVNDGIQASEPKTVTITVNAVVDIIVPATLTVAPNQTLPYNVTLAKPATTDITIDLQNSDSGKATLSITSVTIQANQTQPARQVFITGVANGSTTITATAPGRNPATTNVTVGTSATLTPANLVISSASTDGLLNISLSGQAPSNLVFTVKSSNTNVVTVPQSVPMSTGTQSVAFKVTRVNPGSAVVTVSSPNFPDMTANVTVGEPGNLTLAISNSSLYLWVPQTLTITLSQPAPAGGATVNLQFDPKYLKVSQNPVVIQQGNSSATVQVTGVQVGNPTIGASSPGYSSPTPLTLNVGATIAWASSKLTFPQDARNPQYIFLTLYATVPGGVQFDPADGIVVDLVSTRTDVANFLYSTATFLWDASTEPSLRIPINLVGPGTTILKAKGTNIPEVTMTVVITGPLSITTATLPNGNVGSAYSATVEASGGATPYIWSATGLPNNLTINSATGQITGTPTTSGTFTVNVTVKDASNPQLTANAALQLKINQGTPASIAVSSGSDQTAKINAAFGNPLKALVKDANGNPLSGVTVTFTVQPNNGAGGSFANNQNTAVTDANGIATSQTFTANDKIGKYTVQASVAGANNQTLTANFSLENTIGNPATIAVSSGSPQSAPVNTAFSLPLKAIVKDAGGNAVSGVTVTFTPPASGASGTFAGGVNTAVTDANGVATSAVFTANTTTGGPYNVTAAVAGVNTPANFALTNTAGTPASIAVSSGSPQNVKINTAFGLPLKALVKDINNQPLSGVTVTFTAPASGASGTFAGGVNTAVTDANGIATSAVFTANGTKGDYTVAATVAGPNNTTLTANFSLTNNPGEAASIAVSSGAPQSAPVNTAFSLPLKAIVKDSGGNGVSGVTVTFAPPASGASGTFAGGVNTAVTDTNGIATSAVFTANNTTGGPYNVVASVAGVNTPANFALTNTAGTPTSIVVSSGSPQSAKINAAFALPLKALVKDINNQPLSGVTVTFTPPASGASGAFAGGVNTAVTDANGIATSAVFTANGTVGNNYTVQASVTGANNTTLTANFTLSNTIGDPASIAVSSGSPQSAPGGTAFASLKAIVKDAGGNPVSGVMVTFTAPGSGASGTFTNGQISTTAATGPDGIATASAFTANTSLGSYNVIATAPGANNQTLTTNFALTNSVGNASSIAVSDGSQQSAQAGKPFGKLLKALVKDQANNPVSGVTVTFTAPGSGPSGTFANNTATTTAVTDAAGIATSSVLTANNTQGDFTVTASAGNLTPAVFALTVSSTPPASIEASSGAGQQAQILAVFGLSLKALVKDANNQPVKGATVIFTTPAQTGPSAIFAGGVNMAVTDAAGIATSAALTANSKSGSYIVGATVQNTNISTGFGLTNNPGPASSIVVSGGNNQSVLTNTALPVPLQAMVVDNGGNPVRGITVVFTAPGSGVSGTFSNGGNQISVVSDTGGIASAQLTTNGTLGTFNVEAAVPGIAQKAVFAVTNSGLCTTCGLITLTSAAIGKNLQDSINITLDPPAPAGLTLTILSKDKTKVLVGNSLEKASLTLLAGTANQPINVQALSDTGTVSVEVSAPGYNTSTSIITLAKSGFVIAGPNGIGAAFDTYQGTPTSLTVYAARLDSNGIFSQSQQLRRGYVDPLDPTSGDFSVMVPASLSVNLGTLSPPFITFTGGVNNASLTFTPGGSTGSTDIMVDSVSAGFTKPSTGDKVLATVKTAGLQLISATSVTGLTVGKNLMKPVRVALLNNAKAPADIVVTVTSATPGKLKFAKKVKDQFNNWVWQIADSVTATIATNFNNSPDFYAVGLDNSGSVAFTLSAPNYGTSGGNIPLAPSGFAIESAGGFGASTFQVQKGSGNSIIGVYVGAFNGVSFIESQMVAPGNSIPVTVQSSDVNVGTIATSPINIAAETDNALTYFSPVNEGTTTVTASSTGYTSAQVVGTVASAKLFMLAATAGKNLQRDMLLFVTQPAGAGGVQVTLQSNSASLLLSATAGGVGSSQIVVTIPANSQSVQFFAQNVGANSGSAKVTATSGAFAPATATVTFMPSSIQIAPDVVSGKAGSTTTLNVYGIAYMPDGTIEVQAAAGGLPINVPVQTTSAGIASVPANVTIPGGAASANLVVDLKSAGTANISITQPAGFTNPSTGTTSAVTVNP